METMEISDTVVDIIRTRSGLREKHREQIGKAWDHTAKQVRWTCANLISTLAHSGQQSMETILTATEIVDRFLAVCLETCPSRIAAFAPRGLRLLAGTILLLASKIAEVDAVLGVDDLVAFYGRRLPMTMLRLELEVGAVVGFAFPTPSTGYFLAELVRAAALSDMERSLAEYLVELSLASSGLMHRTPLLLVAAAVKLSLEACRGPQATPALVWRVCDCDELLLNRVVGELVYIARSAACRDSMISQQYPRAYLELLYAVPSSP
jgi:hypothetical protein